MSYLKFDKAELVNLEYSLAREVLATNKTGGYLNTTIVGCNTRKYHGLFVLPVKNFESRRYVLLSSLDETLIQHGRDFNLGIHCYGKNNYEPRGHKYIVDFEFEKYPVTVYRVGGIKFSKSLLFLHNKEQLLIKYTLLDAHSETTLRLRPFLAFREIHTLTHANEDADRNFAPVDGGAAFRLYDGFPSVNIQINRSNDYFHSPDWYYNIEYSEEKRRGFLYQEDLYTPGYFELPIKKGESVIVSVSTSEVSARGLAGQFTREEARRISLQSYDDCLMRAAKQFIVNSGKGLKEIYCGYTWLGKGLRETLIALPGLTLFADGDTATLDDVLESAFKVYGQQLVHGSKQADAALWLFWVVQQYAEYTGDQQGIWLKYRERLTRIIKSFMDGGRMGVRLDDNGLLWVAMHGVAMSWMNAYDSEGNPVTERSGYQVETNAFWYNAVSYVLDKESRYGNDTRLIYRLQTLKDRMDVSFRKVFWIEDRRHLADYVDACGQNTDVRPNQMFTCALEYSPLTEEEKASVMECVKKELLTSRGIRTLSPKNPLYKGVYDGDQNQRDHAYHQGSTRVWLLTFYIEAMFKLYGTVSVRRAVELVGAFEEDIERHGVGAVCELYDGDPPHNPHGAISSAVATASLLRSEYLINKYKKEEL
ncbi:MAG TPA: amylo-alpha-1,6-glucosidase [Candidatus Coprenecus stercoravium]|uniref:Amylo-alpha-1,6-glucosidase n=1 Tax=Candidatus Coprenecus stercoravium TaxID=2840735 RepID=A0A9D2GS86_9BACT|nr:amylo-alpha-1,6-glucosidase [Candidatus Coprenecus stercoravium]